MLRKCHSLLSLYLVSFIIILSSCTATIIKSIPTIPVEKFTLFVQEATIKQCSPVANQCRKRDGRITGSGVLIAKSESHSAILTAGHNCENKVGDVEVSMTTGLPIIDTIMELKSTIKDYEGETYDVVSTIIDSEIDLCIIVVDELIPYDPIHVSFNPPKVGEKFWNIAAPDNTWSPRAPLIFEGIYSGKWDIDDEENRDSGVRVIRVDRSAYTIPTFTGSSGSPILNQNFELVGILVARPPERPIHVGFSPTFEQMKKFLNSNLDEYVVGVDE